MLNDILKSVLSGQKLSEEDMKNLMEKMKEDLHKMIEKGESRVEDKEAAEHSKDVDDLEEELGDLVQAKPVGVIIPAMLGLMQKVFGSLLMDAKNAEDLDERNCNIADSVKTLTKQMDKIHQLAQLKIKLDM